MAAKPLFEHRPHLKQATQSWKMSRRLRTKNPGYNILRAVRRRLLEQPWVSGVNTQEQEAITDAIALVDLCISRVNSTLEV